MRIITFLIIYLLTLGVLYSQESDTVRGSVYELTDGGEKIPVAGANVMIQGTQTGTITDGSGSFLLKGAKDGGVLIVSCIGYKADTVMLPADIPLRIQLIPEAKQVGEMVVVGEQAATALDYKSAGFIQTMNQKELFKAACCNLSESFETNPSIDVSFSDAITGLKQIEMLGLAGVYSQITVENMPAIRGLSSSVGLTYMPGTWMQSIQVSKGVGSVANGYESITGQINVELRKPEDRDEEKLFINLFGNSERRFEGNLNYRVALGDHVDGLTLLHGSLFRDPIDGNGDRFLDLPLSRTLNLLQRFHIAYPDRFENQIGFQYVSDEKEGGTLNGHGNDSEYLGLNPKEYAFGMKTKQLRLFGKNGYVFPGSSYSSVAMQWSFARFDQDATYNFRRYQGKENMGYVNMLFQSSIDSTIHKYRFGVSFLLDEYDESFTGIVTRRIEKVPGIFAEYTYNPSELFSMIAGVRADRNDNFGTFVTPRLHLRYTPSEDWIFRLVGGKGTRTANIISENLAYIASSRNVNVPVSSNGYPFNQESAWNLGFNLTHYFLYDWREGTVVVDFYRTMFDNQVVADVDKDPHQVYFYNLDGKSYSNTIQAEINFQPLERLDTRIAYRYVDTKQTVDGILRERPLIPAHRMLVNLGYTTEREEPADAQMLYDFTLQWFGKKRLPDTQANPDEFRTRQFSPSFIIANGQVTRSFGLGFDLYLGAENLFGFRQHSPIIDPANPDGQYFDSSIIWGPIYGRMLYAGLRWRI